VYPRSVTKREPAGYFFIPGYGPLDPLYGTDVSRNTMSIARAAGGMLSTLHDLTVWTRALYSGHMLPPAQQAKLTSLVSEDTGEPVDSAPTGDNAFGLGVQQSTGAKMGTFWNYEGATFAHRVLHAYLPESGVITLKAYGLTD
jgi:D-alanyl-D-alanine carboxypeptidase